MHAVDLVVPGDIDTLTGGYIYDRRILAGLAHLGWETSVHSLPDSFPEPSADALAVAAAVLAALIIAHELWKLFTGQLDDSELVSVRESEDEPVHAEPAPAAAKEHA